MTKKRGELQDTKTGERDRGPSDGDLAGADEGDASPVLAEGEDAGPLSEDQHGGKHASAGDEGDEAAQQEEADEEEDEDEDEDEEEEEDDEGALASDAETDELKIWEASELDLQSEDEDDDPGRAPTLPGGSRR